MRISVLKELMAHMFVQKYKVGEALSRFSAHSFYTPLCPQNSDEHDFQAVGRLLCSALGKLRSEQCLGEEGRCFESWVHLTQWCGEVKRL